MTLGAKQRKFSLMLAQLITYAYSLGYEITMGRVYASDAANAADGGITGSAHTLKLAADLNLFHDGVYLTETSDHAELGEYWKKMGGTWGGDFVSNPDGNHYSLEHNGVR